MNSLYCRCPSHITLASVCLVVRLMMCPGGLTSPLYAFMLCDGLILPKHGKYGGMMKAFLSYLNYHLRTGKTYFMDDCLKAICRNYVKVQKCH
jgi:hypothetical protein